MELFGSSVVVTLFLLLLSRLLPNPNVLFAISKGMRAVKLCTNKILQFLTGAAS